MRIISSNRGISFREKRLDDRLEVAQTLPVNFRLVVASERGNLFGRCKVATSSQIAAALAGLAMTVTIELFTFHSRGTDAGSIASVIRVIRLRCYMLLILWNCLAPLHFVARRVGDSIPAAAMARQPHFVRHKKETAVFVRARNRRFFFCVPSAFCRATALANGSNSSGYSP